MKFRCRIGHILNEHGIQQRTLAKESGVHFVNVSKIVNGHETPTLSTIVRLLNAIENMTHQYFDVRELWEPIVEAKSDAA